MKPEDKLQHNIVMRFSQTYPQHRGKLWAVFNEDSKHKRALGMHPGASDLQMFSSGIYAGIEVKAPNSNHNKHHITSQLEWGEMIIANGGYYIMSQYENEINDFIDAMIFKDFERLEIITRFALERVKGYLNNGKTVKFK